VPSRRGRPGRPDRARLQARRQRGDKVIVRIATEGQYDLDEANSDRFHELDQEAVAAIDANDEAAFRKSFDAILELVRSGERLDDDHLGASDLILPPPDVDFQHAREEFPGGELIPD